MSLRDLEEKQIERLLERREKLSDKLSGSSPTRYEWVDELLEIERELTLRERL